MHAARRFFVLLAVAGLACDSHPLMPSLEPSAPHASVVAVPPGVVVVSHDEWITTNFGFAQAPTVAQFVLNLASLFSGGGTGNFLAYSTNFSLTDTQIGNTLTGAGHAWTVSTAVPFTLADLLQYDGVFLAGDAADNAVLIQYVNAGGNVYLMGGTGAGGAAAEAARWNAFLNAFGLHFGSVYNGVQGVFPTTSAHTLFNGVTGLYYNNGNTVSELNPADPNTEILEMTSTGIGLIAIATGAAAPMQLIDIKPADPNNFVDPRSSGRLPVAILSSAGFDATTVDPETVTLGNGSAPETRAWRRPDGSFATFVGDLNNDGRADLLVYFSIRSLVELGDLSLTTTSLTLTGRTFGGDPVQGSDFVNPGI